MNGYVTKACYFKTRLGPDGIHCFDRKTGNNILLDEINIPQNFWARAPRQISIALTNACDLACTHCYAPKHRAVLELGLLKKWLLDLDANGCVGVGFGGGEPTLYPHFVDLCHFVANDSNLALTMTTHGHRLTPKMLKVVAAHVNFLRISMDGINSTYEKIRGKPFDEFLQKVSHLANAVPFGINFVVNSTTVKDLSEAVELAEEFGASEFLLLPEVGVGRGSLIDAYTKRKMQKWINNYKGKMKLTISQNNKEGIQICEPFEKELGVSAYAHIDASGVLKRHSFEQDGVLIKGDSIMDALQALREKNEGENS